MSIIPETMPNAATQAVKRRAASETTAAFLKVQLRSIRCQNMAVRQIPSMTADEEKTPIPLMWKNAGARHHRNRNPKTRISILRSVEMSRGRCK